MPPIRKLAFRVLLLLLAKRTFPPMCGAAKKDPRGSSQGREGPSLPAPGESPRRGVQFSCCRRLCDDRQRHGHGNRTRLPRQPLHLQGERAEHFQPRRERHRPSYGLAHQQRVRARQPGLLQAHGLPGRNIRPHDRRLLPCLSRLSGRSRDCDGNLMQASANSFF